MRDAGITRILIDFDGEGDSGQINNVTAYKGDQETQLPEVIVDIYDASWAMTRSSRTGRSFPRLLKIFTTGTWSRNTVAGKTTTAAMASFQSTVAQRTVTLEFHSRYTAYETHSHSF